MICLNEIDEVLLHYGKKGMKWGVRKRVSVGAKKVKKGVKAFVKDYKKSSKEYHKKVAKREKADLESYHEKNKHKKGYQRLYKKFKSPYMTRAGTIKAIKNYQHERNARIIKGVGTIATPLVKKGVKAAYKYATSKKGNKNNTGLAIRR